MKSFQTSTTLTLALLLVTMVSHSWSAPQRRNWIPQAMLYLKGAQRGHYRFISEGRKEGDSLHLARENSDDTYFQDQPMWKTNYVER